MLLRMYIDPPTLDLVPPPSTLPTTFIHRGSYLGECEGSFWKISTFYSFEALRMNWKLYKNTRHRKPTKLSTISVTHFLETFLQAWNQIKNEAIQATAFVLLFIRLQFFLQSCCWFYGNMRFTSTLALQLRRNENCKWWMNVCLHHFKSFTT